MNGSRILAFGAHPDDIEFGCGAVLLDAKGRGAQIELAILSRGEAGSQGDAATREREARAAAELLDGEIRFLDTDGDTCLRADVASVRLAADLIRSVKPDIVFAPTGHRGQHPDHREASALVRDACRLARYGNTPGLEEAERHAIQLLLFYDISSEAVGEGDMVPLLVDVSEQVEAWKRLMRCHASQVKRLDYIELQLSRARALGIRMGVHSATRLYSEGPVLMGSAGDLLKLRGARL